MPALKRTPFKKKPNPTYLRRQRALMGRVGKKGRENRRVNREKKAEHIKLGIQTCELRVNKDCTPFDNLDWSHSMKRRKMGKWGSDERAINMRESVVACRNCHTTVEAYLPDELLRVHKEAIEMRGERRLEAA